MKSMIQATVERGQKYIKKKRTRCHRVYSTHNIGVCIGIISGKGINCEWVVVVYLLSCD